jgi:hypothetical protein
MLPGYSEIDLHVDMTRRVSQRNTDTERRSRMNRIKNILRTSIIVSIERKKSLTKENISYNPFTSIGDRRFHFWIKIAYRDGQVELKVKS